MAAVACGGSDEGAGGSGGKGATGGSGGGGATGAGGATQPQEANYRPCDPTSKVGQFELGMKTDNGTSLTIFQGSVKDGVNPLEVFSVTQSSGVCRVSKQTIRQCSPACTGDTPLCGLDSKCVASPKQKDLGTLTLTGLTQALTATPSGTKFYTNKETIAYPGVTEGADVTLSSSGGDYPAFTLSTKGIAPLEVTSTTPAVKKGLPITLSWKPPLVSSGARVYMVVSLDNHGTTSQQLECDAPDTGSFEIPAALVDALSTLGVSGFPTMTLKRRSVESKTVGNGCVEFNVTAEAVLDLAVDGVTSCRTTEDCPMGKTCEDVRRVCK
ncbi:MAG: hypothetical protein SF187_17610 [Deltaproteobacteria bacterium]|nr:hypothetical protein [Deltaproteobacteria bacterium]